MSRVDVLRFGGWNAGAVVVVLVATLVLAALVAVGLHRLLMQRDSPQEDRSMTRPALALLLVGTLVVLATASMWMHDRQTRNLLVGGVVSLSSAAVAFYFSSKNATEARRDLLRATSGVTVPDLYDMTLARAQEVVSRTSLRLAKVDPPPGDATVTSQDPEAGSATTAGATVTLTF